MNKEKYQVLLIYKMNDLIKERDRLLSILGYIQLLDEKDIMDNIDAVNVKLSVLKNELSHLMND